MGAESYRQRCVGPKEPRVEDCRREEMGGGGSCSPKWGLSLNPRALLGPPQAQTHVVYSLQAKLSCRVLEMVSGPTPSSPPVDEAPSVRG